MKFVGQPVLYGHTALHRELLHHALAIAAELDPSYIRPSTAAVSAIDSLWPAGSPRVDVGDMAPWS